MEDMAEAAILDMELSTPNASPNGGNNIEILGKIDFLSGENFPETFEEIVASSTCDSQQAAAVSLYDADMFNDESLKENNACFESAKLPKNVLTSEITTSIFLTDELEQKNKNDEIVECEETAIEDVKDAGVNDDSIEDDKETGGNKDSLEDDKETGNEAFFEDEEETRCDEAIVVNDKETTCKKDFVETDKVTKYDEASSKGYRETGMVSDREEGELSPELCDAAKEQVVEKTDDKSDAPETKNINFQSIEQYYDNLEKIYVEAKRMASELQERFSHLMDEKQLQSIENRISAMKPVKIATSNPSTKSTKKSKADSEARSHAKSSNNARHKSPSYRGRYTGRLSKERERSRRNYTGGSNGRTPNRSKFGQRRPGDRKSPKNDSIQKKIATEENESKRSKHSCSRTRRRSHSHSSIGRQTEDSKGKMFLDKKRQRNYKSAEGRNRRISPRHSDEKRKDGNCAGLTKGSRDSVKPSKTKERKEKQRVKTLVTRQMKMISDHIDNPKPIFERSSAHSNVNLKKTKHDQSEDKSVKDKPPSTKGLQSLEDLQNFLDVLKERNRGKLSKDASTSSYLEKLKLEGEFGINAPRVIEQSRISITASAPNVRLRQSSTNIKNKDLFFQSSKSKTEWNSGSKSLTVQENADKGQEEVQVQNLPEYEMTSPLRFNEKGDHGKRMGRSDAEKERNTYDRPPVKFEFKSNRNLKNSQIPQIFLNSDGYAIEQVPSNREHEPSTRDSGHEDLQRETSTKLIHQGKSEMPKEKSREILHKSKVHDDMTMEKKDEKRGRTLETQKHSKASESKKRKELHTSQKRDGNEQIKLKKQRVQEDTVDDSPSTSPQESEWDTSHRSDMPIQNKEARKKRKREVKMRKKIIILGNDKIQKFVISPDFLEMLISKQVKEGMLLKAKKETGKQKQRQVSKKRTKSTTPAKKEESEWSLEKLEAFTESLRKKHGRNLDNLNECEFAVKEDIRRESRFLDRHRAKRKAKLMACAFLASTNTSKEARLMESIKKTKTEDDLEAEKVLKKMKAETDAVMSTDHDVHKQIWGKTRKGESRRTSEKRSQAGNKDGVAHQNEIYVSFPLKNVEQEQQTPEDTEGKAKAHLFSSKAQVLLNNLRAKKKKEKKPQQQHHDP